jgi:Predicted xylanase/chitin deacetylase
MQKFKLLIILFILFLVLGVVLFCVFFDEAVLVRKGTIFHYSRNDKVVALTFDDGPSPIWTPKILDELKKANIKATFLCWVNMWRNTLRLRAELQKKVMKSVIIPMTTMFYFIINLKN